MRKILNYENYRKIVRRFNPFLASRLCAKQDPKQAGFSLIEVSIAMVIFLIAVLGVFISFAYAVSYNSGNTSRAQALALLQQKVEQMRSARFVPTSTDASLTGGTKAPEIVTSPDGNLFRLNVIVDDDPFTPGVQVDATQKFKEISVTVSLEAPTPGWQSSVPATIILRRVRGN
jgi:prepilin-type N-terminal cleavage/methylation domain-containing protein